MTRRRITGFAFDFDWRELKDPDGPPTLRQLARLNYLGCLELVPAGVAEPITKAQAAAAIDDAGDTTGRSTT